VFGLDRPARELDARVAQTFDRQIQTGLLDEVLDLNSRYDLDDELRRRGKRTRNQVLHTHGYREFWELALERQKSVRSLNASDLSIVRQRVVDHIQAYTRRQRGAFRKLRGVRMIRTADRAHQLVRAALR